METPQKRILITFGRSFLALQLARQLSAAGHKVFIADSMRYHITRFSNKITKNFYVPSPRFNAKGYVKVLVDIVEQEKIDLLIPIYEEISYLSKATHLFPKSCTLFFPDFDLYDQLHNKWSFQCKLDELGIKNLKKALIKNKEDLKTLDFKTPFALKACYSRASQKVKKVHPQDIPNDLKFESHNPWIAQEWLDGERFCTYTICQNGEVCAHSVYPVGYTLDGNSCIAFQSIEHPGVLDWVKKFVKKINFTGQIAFDFIESKDNKIYAIECNPRATSGLLLFNGADRLDRAFFKTTDKVILPKVNAKRQIAFGMLLYGWRKISIPNNNFFRFLKDLLTTKDVVLSPYDLKPVLFEPLILLNIMLNGKRYNLPIPDAFIYDHEWNGETITL